MSMDRPLNGDGSVRVCNCGRPTVFARRRAANGWSVVAWCEHHARIVGAPTRNPPPGSRTFYPLQWFTEEQLESMPVLPAVEPKDCAVCGGPGPLELHHTAPRAVFGPEAESWPTVEVCGPCHRRWHYRMDGAK